MGDVGAGMIGLAAVVLSLGIPMAAMYTFFRVKKLKTDERMAAIARGVAVPFDASGMALITEALLAEGLDEPSIAKVMGGNAIRVIRASSATVKVIALTSYAEDGQVREIISVGEFYDLAGGGEVIFT